MTGCHALKAKKMHSPYFYYELCIFNFALGIVRARLRVAKGAKAGAMKRGERGI